MILFLGAGAAAARPAAAWLQRFIDARRPAQQVTATQSAPAAPATATLDTTTAAYTFSAGSHELRIEFAGAGPDAELVVHTYDQSAVPPVLILPNGVAITNATSRGTRYELALPRNVDVLVVSIAGRAPQRISAGSLPARIRLNEGR